MRKKNSKIFFCLLIFLMLNISTVFAYTENYQVTLRTQVTDVYCGPASTQMNLFKIQSTYRPSQSTIYNYASAYQVSSIWATDPRMMDYAIAHWTPAGYYYCDWNYEYSTGAIRGIANNIQQWNQPISVLIKNGAHWISVHGAVSNTSVYGNYSTATVYGFYVTDPLYGRSQYYFSPNQYVTAPTFAKEYFKPVTLTPTNDPWYGKYVSIERNSYSGNNKRSLYDYNNFSHY